MKLKLFKNITLNILLAFMAGLLAHEVSASVNPLAVAGGIFLTHFAVDTVLTFTGHKTQAPKMLFMAIQTEIWTKDIVENIFRDNPFMKYAFSGDQYVLQGKVVHIPVAGSKPSVVKNRSSLPATITQRTDTDITYVLDEFTTDPILIPNADTIELSYDKRQNVLAEHQQALSELVGDDMLIKWVSSNGGATTLATIIRTTGGTSATAVPAHLPSSTGNRLKYVKEDLKKAQTQMNKDGIAKTERYAMADAEMTSQLLDDPDLIKRDYAQEANLKEGIIGQLYGFTLLDRSYVLAYNNASTPVVKALGAAAAATDNAAVICWQKNAVERALGTVKFFENLNDPTNYGDVYSALLRAGGRIRRATGVVVIVQAATT